MKILITGALGHIGSKLIRELPQQIANLELDLLDNLATERYCSLFNLPSTARYNFIEQDLLTFELDPLVESNDLVIHLAAITDPSATFHEPTQIYQHNLRATEKVALSCLRNNVKLLFPSSTSVYTPQTSFVDEYCDAQSLQPVSPYAKCKLAEESLLLQLHSEQQLQVAICRFGTIFGVSTGMRFHTAVNKFCWQAIFGKPVSVWETAYNQQRPYLSINDAINVISFIINNDLFNGKVYNAVTGNYTVANVIASIKNYIPEVKVQLVQHPIMNDLSFAVINKQLSKYNFNFIGNITEEIKETIATFANVNNYSPRINL